MGEGVLAGGAIPICDAEHITRRRVRRTPSCSADFQIINDESHKIRSVLISFCVHLKVREEKNGGRHKIEGKVRCKENEIENTSKIEVKREWERETHIVHDSINICNGSQCVTRGAPRRLNVVRITIGMNKVELGSHSGLSKGSIRLCNSQLDQV